MFNLGLMEYDNHELDLQMAAEICDLHSTTEVGGLPTPALTANDFDQNPCDNPKLILATTESRITMDSLIEASKPGGDDGTSVIENTTSIGKAVGFGKAPQESHGKSLPTPNQMSLLPEPIPRPLANATIRPSTLLPEGLDEISPKSFRDDSDQVLWKGLMDPRDADASSSSPLFTSHLYTESGAWKRKYDDMEFGSEDFDRDTSRQSSKTHDPHREELLAKNRLAASKCRSKQKQKEEALRTQAEDARQRNKMLNAELDKLKVEAASLLNIVAGHANCDDRLGQYVRRAVDKLLEQKNNSGQANGAGPPIARDKTRREEGGDQEEDELSSGLEGEDKAKK